jgi:hypothetical protein
MLKLIEFYKWLCCYDYFNPKHDLEETTVYFKEIYIEDQKMSR